MNVFIYARGTVITRYKSIKKKVNGKQQRETIKVSDKQQVTEQIQACRDYIKKRVDDVTDDWHTSVTRHTKWRNKKTGKVYVRKTPTPWKQQYVDRGVVLNDQLSQRRQWVALMTDVQSGDMIVCQRLRALTVSSLECASLLKELSKRKVQIYVLELDQEITTSKAFKKITNCFASQESTGHKVRLKQSKRKMKEDNLYRGGTVPFGYDKTPDGKRLVKNKDYTIVTAIMKYREDKKMTFGEIAHRLQHDHGIKKHRESISRIFRYEREQRLWRSKEDTQKGDVHESLMMNVRVKV